MYIDEQAEEKYRKMRLNETTPEPESKKINEEKDEEPEKSS